MKEFYQNEVNKQQYMKQLVEDLKQLEENISSAKLTLSDDVIREIDRISQPVLDALGDCADYYESLENSRIY